MASNNANNTTVAIGNATTWGTAVDLASVGVGKLIYCTSLSITGGYETVQPNDAGFGNAITELARTKASFEISITCDLSYHGQWLQPLASFLGAASTPTEQTVGQGDYLHNLDLTSSGTYSEGKLQTLCFAIESDKIAEIPTVIWTSASINMEAAGVGTVTLTGIGSNLLYDTDATNVFATFASLTAPTYQTSVFCGANHYVRLDDYSTTTALTNADDKEILNFNIELSRPLEAIYVSRGALTNFPNKPRQAGVTTGTFSVQLAEIDSSKYNFLTKWKNRTRQMAEIFVDGAQIGTGVNTSIKIQLPYMQMDELPETGFSGNTDLRQPTLNFTLIKPATAPSGMSGVTNYCRFAVITERATAYA
jgi:hypothetical protein